MKLQLEQGEEVIYNPELLLLDKIISYFIIIILPTLLIKIFISGDFIVGILALLIFIPAIYISIYALKNEVSVSNKKIYFKTLFFKEKSIELKNIRKITSNPPAGCCPSYGFVQIKTYEGKNILKYLFPKNNFVVADQGEFTRTVVEYIQNSIPDNNLE